MSQPLIATIDNFSDRLSHFYDQVETMLKRTEDSHSAGLKQLEDEYDQFTLQVLEMIKKINTDPLYESLKEKLVSTIEPLQTDCRNLKERIHKVYLLSKELDTLNN